MADLNEVTDCWSINWLGIEFHSFNVLMKKTIKLELPRFTKCLVWREQKTKIFFV